MSKLFLVSRVNSIYDYESLEPLKVFKNWEDATKYLVNLSNKDKNKYQVTLIEGEGFDEEKGRRKAK